MNTSGLRIDQIKITPAQLGGLVKLVEAQTINSSTAKLVLEEMFSTGADADAIAVDMHQLVGNRHDEDHRPVRRTLRVPVEFTVLELARMLAIGELGCGTRHQARRAGDERGCGEEECSPVHRPVRSSACSGSLHRRRASVK